MRTVTKSNPEQDFFSFMSKRRKNADVLPVFAQNKRILHMACVMTLTGSGMLLTLRHYIGFLSYAVDVLRYVALNVVNLRCLVVIHWSFHWRRE